MKQLLLYLSIPTICGSPFYVSQNPVDSHQVNPPLPRDCPEKPTRPLEEVENFFFDDRPVTKSAKLNVGEQIGYTFYSSSDSTLTYSTNDGICIWVYAPDLELINPENIQSTGEQQISLTKNGKYTIQVSGRQNSQEFTLEMSLDTPLTRSQAVNLIQNWLEAKNRIFAPPYNQELAARYLTGQDYQDAIRLIKYLQENKIYYRYSSHSTSVTAQFSYTAKRATIEVIITERFQEYKKNEEDVEEIRDRLTTQRYRFKLQRVNNSWKIKNRYGI